MLLVVGLRGAARTEPPNHTAETKHKLKRPLLWKGHVEDGPVPADNFIVSNGVSISAEQLKDEEVQPIWMRLTFTSGVQAIKCITRLANSTAVSEHDCPQGVRTCMPCQAGREGAHKCSLAGISTKQMM
jgi:hypothetical protein